MFFRSWFPCCWFLDFQLKSNCQLTVQLNNKIRISDHRGWRLILC